MRRWPDTIPSPVFRGYALRPAEQSIRSDMEVGTRRLRRISAARRDDVSVPLRLTDAEFSALRAWWSDDAWSLAGHSDSLADWSLTNVTRFAADVVGPDLVVVDRIEETSDNGQHRVSRTLDAAAWASADRVVLTATLLGAGRAHARVGLVGRDGTFRYGQIDLTTGAVTASNAGAVATDRGGGWWRLAVDAPVESGVTAPQMRILILQDAGTASYAGTPGLGMAVAEVMARRATGQDLFLPTDSQGRVQGAAGGSAWFRADLAFGGGLRRAECRSLEPMEARALEGLNWDVMLALETRDA